MMNLDEVLDKIFNYYKKYGEKDYIGEEITQNEHMIQGAMFAERDGKPLEVVLALFLHDILNSGSVNNIKKVNTDRMGEFGACSHEKKGRCFLERMGVPYPIPQLVENHVISKRYLVSTDSNYYNKLSNASKKTLEYQGGIMSQSEIEYFQKDPLFKMSLKVREYDEMSKLKNVKLNPLIYYREMLKKYLM